MRKLRVLYLSPYFWPEEIGSAPYCSDLAFWLAAKGHDVQTIAFRPHYPKPDRFPNWSNGSRDVETHNGVSISRVAVSGRGSGGVKDRLKNDLRYLFSSCRRVLTGKIGQVDTVVAYVPSIFTLYVAAMLRLVKNVRVVAVVHDIESGLARSLGMASNPTVLRLMTLVEKVGLSFAHEIVVLTNGMKDELVAIGCRTPISVLPIWADTMPVRLKPVGDQLVIGYSGNFGKKQNLDQLIPLLARLYRERPDIQVVLRGDGSEKARIQQDILANGISNVVFEPLAPLEKLTEALQSFDIHLVPQALDVANYALPSKLFSIMAAGRPFVCVATPHTALDEFARDSGGGICVAPGDDEALWQEITELLDDPERRLRMGQSGRDYVQNNMSRDTIASAYEEILLRSGSSKKSVETAVNTTV